MPLYPVINLKTKEKKTLHITIEKYEEWKKENPDWDKDWSQGCAGTRSRGSSAYGVDSLAADSSYSDKNNSLSHSYQDKSGTPTASNSQVKQKYGW